MGEKIKEEKNINVYLHMFYTIIFHPSLEIYHRGNSNVITYLSNALWFVTFPQYMISYPSFGESDCNVDVGN